MWLIEYYLLLLKYCLTVKLKIMANIQYGSCRWCGREYRGGTGEWYGLCSKKCQTQFYREYPNQAKADLEQSKRDKF